MKRSFWVIGYSIALVAFTVYIVLDTFVLTEVYQEDATQMNTSMFENISQKSIEEDDADSGNETETTEEISDTSENETNRENSDTEQPRSSRHGKGHGKNESEGSTSDETDRQTDTNEQDGSASQDTSDHNASVTEVYQNENVKITLTEYYENNTKIYVADVRMTSAEYLKTAFANDAYGKNITANTSTIAKEHNAILAINGDYYGVQETGYVIRNGIVYRESGNGADLLCVYADGGMNIVNSDDKTAEQLVEEGVWQAFCFGPALVEDSQINVSEGDEVGKAMASNPRTAIGMIDECHYVFVVSDGRTSESEGLSLYELAQFMKSLGVTTAYNLDGGGSSTMYFNGEVVNNPTTNGNHTKERGVSDIVYIGS